MKKHSILPPSGAHRWTNCTPSARLEQEFENTESEAAREGTAAHALCEHKLKKALRMRSKRPVSDYDSDEMEEWSRRDTVLPVLKENIRTTIEGDTEAQLEEVDREIRVRQAELLNAGNDQLKIDKIGDAIISLREERQAILADAAARQGVCDKFNDLVSFLDEQTTALTDYLETQVRRLIEKITIYDEKITVQFKSGLEIDVDA